MKKPHETIGLLERQRPQQHRVDDAEDCGVRADAQGQNGDDGCIGADPRLLSEIQNDPGGYYLEIDDANGPAMRGQLDAPDYRSGQRPESFPQTRIRTGASLGAGSIVLPGVSVGRWAMIGAGALVTRDVPDFALVYGSPARVHGHVCRCGESLRFNDRKAACACGRRYEIQPDGSIAEVPAS